MKTTKEQFINELEYGWDNAITTLENELENDTSTRATTLKNLCKAYWKAYDGLDSNGDVDSGIVGVVRSNLIQTILEVLEK